MTKIGSFSFDCSTERLSGSFHGIDNKAALKLVKHFKAECSLDGLSLERGLRMSSISPNNTLTIYYDEALESVSFDIEDNDALYHYLTVIYTQLIPDEDDLLDKVSISYAYADRYHKWVASVASKYTKGSTKLDIQDEKARIDENENLIIFVYIQGDKHEFSVPPSDWDF